MCRLKSVYDKAMRVLDEALDDVVDNRDRPAEARIKIAADVSSTLKRMTDVDAYILRKKNSPDELPPADYVDLCQTVSNQKMWDDHPTVCTQEEIDRESEIIRQQLIAGQRQRHGRHDQPP